MARSVSSIENSILTQVADNPVLSGLDTPSQVSISKLWAFITAVSQAVQEQLQDQFVSEVESIALTLAPGSLPWIQEQAFKFQYSQSNPQVIQFNTSTFAPYYPTVNTSYQIVTNCSVLNTTTVGIVSIKVAKGATTSVPTPLDSQELSALQYYFNQIKPAGIIYNCASTAADKLYSVFSIKYQGAYSGVIQSTLLAAYNSYLFNIDFGGVIRVDEIVSVLSTVPGVVNVVCNEMVARQDSVAFGGGTVLVTGDDWIQSEYITVAGYIVNEVTSGEDFISKLNLIAI
jgi:hypothetical protein